MLCALIVGFWHAVSRKNPKVHEHTPSMTQDLELGKLPVVEGNLYDPAIRGRDLLILCDTQRFEFSCFLLQLNGSAPQNGVQIVSRQVHSRFSTPEAFRVPNGVPNPGAWQDLALPGIEEFTAAPLVCVVPCSVLKGKYVKTYIREHKGYSKWYRRGVPPTQ